MRVCVVVLGDVGRSPRMMFHSLSLAAEGVHVDLVGYGGSSPSKKLLENELISIRHMAEPPLDVLSGLPRLLGYGFKAIWQFLTLLYTLFSIARPSHVLVQNPPSVPTLAAVWFHGLIQRSKLIIDWHNYGYSILAITLGNENPLVKFSKCAVVLYDRPPDYYRPLALEEKFEFLTDMCKEYPCFRSKKNGRDSAFMKLSTEGPKYRKSRPALLMSSTSWTEDEDFSILLEALEAYENSIAVEKRADLPRLLCVITGKGPMKEFYESKIQAMKFDYVDFCFPWLSAEDYPKLLAAADVGVCLHTSSSGLDLPMKVVDMFGCGLPVLAFNYNCIDELVKTGENGYVFDNSDQLHQQIRLLLNGFPSISTELETLRVNLTERHLIRWESSWKHHALPLFRDV